MENNINSFLDKKLSREALQELLPDYAFNKLSENEKFIFENNISHFPDLEDELVEITGVFQRVNQYDYNGLLSNGSRNISVKVLNKRVAKSNSKIDLLWKIVLPICLVVTIGFYIGKDFYFDYSFSPKNEIVKSTPIIKPVETKALFNDLTNEELGEKVEIDNSPLQSNSNEIEADKLISEFLTSNYDSMTEKYNNDFYNELDISNNPNVMMNDLKDISEEEFQLLLESMEEIEIES